MSGIRGEEKNPVVTQDGECHVMLEAEIGAKQLETKEPQTLAATPRS